MLFEINCCVLVIKPTHDRTLKTLPNAKFVQRWHARETLHSRFGRNSCGGLTLRISRTGPLPLQKKNMKKFIDSIGKLSSARFKSKWASWKETKSMTRSTQLSRESPAGYVIRFTNALDKFPWNYPRFAGGRRWRRQLRRSANCSSRFLSNTLTGRKYMRGIRSHV